MSKKVLYSTKSVMTPDKYAEMSKSFLSSITSRLFLFDILLIIILLIFNLLIYKISFKYNLALFIVINIIVFINLKINIYNISKNKYIKIMNRFQLPLESESIIDFYEEYLVQRGTRAVTEIYYKDINTAIEKEKYIYLNCSKYNAYILIEKDNCSKELIKFINSKFFH